ncbi:MAG TPA: enoyl-CoA hydratase [Candidatus Saccharimonadales bacterium]|nr:enoyl-CoA hydratase [Candidatus Saccharimonadales bacterium]
MTAGSQILREQRGEVAWVTFDRPEARNAFTYDMYTHLAELCGELAADAATRVIVFQGRGDDAFVSGSDIRRVGEIRTRDDALSYERHIEQAIGGVERIPKPTIALIRGVATGGGAAIALACDLRVAADNARFGVPIARTIGNTMSLRNLARMVEVVGPALTKDLLFTARLAGADEALRAGAFSEVIPLAGIEERVTTLAAQIAGNAPLTVRATKLGVLRIIEAARERIGAGEDIVELAYTSADFQEGVAAFLEKRRPAWTGR